MLSTRDRVDLTLRCTSGASVGTTAYRWGGPLTSADLDVLARARPPVLDIGCGPGRHVVGLNRDGKIALGIDITPRAVELARRRGAPVLERSVYDRIPGTGRWSTALLLDGNLAIGGHAVKLLTRVRTLLAPLGEVLIEVEAPRTRHRARMVRLELGGAPGPWFRWTPLAADQLDGIAARSGLTVREIWSHGRRWFAALARQPGASLNGTRVR